MKRKRTFNIIATPHKQITDLFISQLLHNDVAIMGELTHESHVVLDILRNPDFLQKAKQRNVKFIGTELFVAAAPIIKMVHDGDITKREFALVMEMTSFSNTSRLPKDRVHGSIAESYAYYDMIIEAKKHNIQVLALDHGESLPYHRKDAESNPQAEIPHMDRIHQITADFAKEVVNQSRQLKETAGINIHTMGEEAFLQFSQECLKNTNSNGSNYANRVYQTLLSEKGAEVSLTDLKNIGRLSRDQTVAENYDRAVGGNKNGKGLIIYGSGHTALDHSRDIDGELRKKGYRVFEQSIGPSDIDTNYINKALLDVAAYMGVKEPQSPKSFLGLDPAPAP